MSHSWLIRRGNCLFTGMGCLLLAGAAIGCLFSIVQWWGAERADGTVVKVDRRFDSDGDAFYPVVEYAVGGQPFQCTGSFGFNPPVYRAGERVSVLYFPARPQEAVIDRFAQRWGGYAIFAAVGFLFVVVSRGMSAPAGPP